MPFLNKGRNEIAFRFTDDIFSRVFMKFDLYFDFNVIKVCWLGYTTDI